MLKTTQLAKDGAGIQPHGRCLVLKLFVHSFHNSLTSRDIWKAYRGSLGISRLFQDVLMPESSSDPAIIPQISELPPTLNAPPLISGF